MSFHAPNISKNLLEAVAAVMVEGAKEELAKFQAKLDKISDDGGKILPADLARLNELKRKAGVSKPVKEEEQIEEGAAGRMLAKSPTAKKDMEDAGDSTMTYRGKDEKGVYTVKKHRAKGASEYKEVGQRVYEDVEQLDEVEITPAEYRALKSGSVKFDDLAKKKGVSVSTLRGEYSLHDDHMRQGEDHYKKLFKEDEQLDEVSDKLLHNYMRKADQASANWSHNERRAAAGDKDAAARSAKDQKRHAGIDLAKKKLANKPNTPVKEDVEQVAEGAFSDIDIDQKETKADPKRKAEYTKDFNELLAKHKDAGLDPSQRKRLRRLATILGKKLPGE